MNKSELNTFARNLGLSRPNDKQFKNTFPAKDFLDNNGIPTISGPPPKELAAAIGFYIFAACEALDDFCINKNVFGGWNRVTCYHRFDEETDTETCVWGAWESHCTSDFIALCKERLPWVEIWK